jgi:ActR/RegA family two-component response regulator
MRTERVTYLTSAEHKAQLEAFAKSRGESVGSVLREATAQYMAKPADQDDDERMLKLLVDEINEAAPRILASMDRLSAKMQKMHKENDAFLRKIGVRQ